MMVVVVVEYRVVPQSILSFPTRQARKDQWMEVLGSYEVRWRISGTNGLMNLLIQRIG